MNHDDSRRFTVKRGELQWETVTDIILSNKTAHSIQLVHSTARQARLNLNTTAVPGGTARQN